MGRKGAKRLIADEMEKRYSWPMESFPTMMEQRGFPQNKSDGLDGFHYRWTDICNFTFHHLMQRRDDRFGKDQGYS